MALPHSTDVFKYPARYQFGQPGVPMALAQTACVDTCVQMLIEYWKDRSVTLGDIRKASGGPHDGVHGLNIPQTLKALNAYGVRNYKVARGVSPAFVHSKLSNGPAMTVVGYSRYPTYTQGHCGHTNDARIGGRNDCGFGGTHAILLIAHATLPTHTGIYSRDPDHNSGSRPYRPAYDGISADQLSSAMGLITHLGWSSTYLLYSDIKK